MRRPASGCSRCEALADEAQDGHLALGPFDAPDALGREAEVGDVVRRAVWPERRHRTGASVVIDVGLLCVGGKKRRSGATMLSQRRAATVGEALLEADVLAIAEGAVGGQRRRVVGADVEHDLVARCAAAPGSRRWSIGLA